MPISPARIAAFEILLRVQTTQAFASELLHSSRYAKLSPVDHGLAAEIVFGVLRWRSLLDEQIAKRSSLTLRKLDPEVLIALRIAAYQIIFLDRIARHAAVHESVELVRHAHKRSAVAFANAVLRRFDGETAQSVAASIADSQTAFELARSAAHPEWLVERWVQEFGFEVAGRICIHNQTIPETYLSLRDSSAEQHLKDERVELVPGDLLRSARRVVNGNPTLTRAFRTGKISIQDEASQLVAGLVGEGNRILDCCAAPGGKTKILAMNNPSAQVVAVELHPHRAKLLRRRISAANVSVIVADARNLPTNALFDRILVDEPCSGTGTLARNPEIKWRLRPEDLTNLQDRQIAILQSATQRLTSGGKLVYSTCSLEREENETVVQAAVSANSSLRIVDCRDRLGELRVKGELVANIESITRGPYLRTIPGVHRCDGFFAAILERV